MKPLAVLQDLSGNCVSLYISHCYTYNKYVSRGLWWKASTPLLRGQDGSGIPEMPRLASILPPALWNHSLLHLLASWIPQ